MISLFRTVLFPFIVLVAGCTQPRDLNREEYPLFYEPAHHEITKDSETHTALPHHGPNFHIVTIRGMQFQPSLLVIAPGDTVQWNNADFALHDITEDKNKTWSSRPLEPGKTWSRICNENTDYFCSLHVVMRGSIRVSEQSQSILP
jgi:plastocyanin